MASEAGSNDDPDVQIYSGDVGLVAGLPVSLR